MKNLIFKSRFLVLFIGLLTMCVTQVWGANPVKCTSTSDLVAGSTYYISGADTYSSTATAMGLSTGGNNFPASTFGRTPAELTLGGNATNGWTFSYVDGSTTYYLDPTKTTSNNHLKRSTSVTDYGKFTISFSNGAAVITSKGKNLRNIIRYNSSSSCYSCYSSGQEAVYLYKKASAAPATAYTVTFNAGTNGTCLTSSLKEASAGAGVTLPTVSAKPGYRFVGWSTSSTPTSADAGAAGANYRPLANNCTLYAYYVQTHTVNWYVNGSATPVTVDHGAYLAIPDGIETDIECNGKVFVGWCETASYSHPTTAPTGMFTSASGTVDDNANYYAVFATASAGGAEPSAYTVGTTGDFVLAVYYNSKWYALPNNPTVNSGKITGVEITVNTTASSVNYVTTANASGYIWTIANATNGQTISDGTKYIYHANGGASGTNLEYDSNTTFTWKIESEANGLTFKGMSGSTVNSRGMLGSNNTFGGYALSNEDASGYYRIQVLPIGGGSTYTDD